MPAAYNPSGYKNVSSYLDRHGQRRWRYRKGGFTTNLGTEYEGAEFFYKLENAQRGIRVTIIPSDLVEVAQSQTRKVRGAMAFALEDHLEDDRHRRNAEITKRHRANRVANLIEAFGHLSIKDIRVEDIQRYMDENKHRPTSANLDLGILRAVLEDAVTAGTIKANPAASVKRWDVETLGFHTWSEDDIATYFDHHEPGTTAALAMALMLYTGANRKEAVEFGWHNLTGDRFKFARHQNTSHKHLTLIDIPLHPDLRAILDKLPTSHRTFLQTEAGETRTAAGLGNKMREWADAAGLSNCTSHGLRKACARRLAEAGAREQEVAAVLGYSDTTSPHVIVGMGHRPELADEGFAALAEAGHDSTSVTEAA